MKREIIISGIVFFILLGIFFSFTPCIKKESKGYNCRLCGAQKGKRTTYVLSIPVWTTWTKIQENNLTKIYEDNIGIEHEHQWAGGGYSRTNYTLLHRGVHADGMHIVKPYIPLQRYLTNMALRAVDQVKIWPKEKKIALYYAILDCTSEASYTKIQEIYNSSLLNTKGFRCCKSN